MNPDRRRSLPSVDRLLREPAVAHVLSGASRAAAVRAVREALAEVRAGRAPQPSHPAGWADTVAGHRRRDERPGLRRCVNATGVVVHTNLGRAPLAPAAARAVAEAAAGYSSLEYDLERGARGDRQVHVAGLLKELTGAGDALAVNNCASALLLALNTAAAGGRVAVSRGELVEIGGGFRIPEILERSGAELVEVGTTNRTRLADYERLFRGRGAAVDAILKVHRSNFRLQGFTAEATLEELVALGRKVRRPVLYDLGSGLMLPPGPEELAGEPTLPAAIRSGAAAVVVSGDKLLGGPQAGILVGRKSFVARCRSNPLARAVRADKLTLAGLIATLALYRDPDAARREIPVLRMLTESAEDVAERARDLAARLPASAHAEVVATRAAPGGGTYPGVTFDSAGVALRPDGLSAADLAERLRGAPVPVVATVARERVVLDVRTLLPGDDDDVVRAVEQALA